MIEMIGRPFVILVAFLAVLAVLVSGASTIIGANNPLSSNTQQNLIHERMLNSWNPGELAALEKNYTFLPPGQQAIGPVAVGSFLILLGGGSIATDTVPLTYNDETNVLAYVVQGSAFEYVPVSGGGSFTIAFPVWIFLHQEWGGFLGFGMSSATVQLNEASILSHLQANGTSLIDLNLRFGYTAFLKPDAGTFLQHDWETHSNFSLSIGQTKQNASKLTAGDAFTIIGQIMTFSVPNVSFWVNAILATVLFPTYLIMGFFLIRSLIPLLGG